MKVLIAGGSGLIGTALTHNLVKDGHEVIILSRNPAKGINLPEGARAAAWDGKTGVGWGGLVNEVDAVVNLAGANLAGESPLNMRWTKKRKELLFSSRVNAGSAITAAIEAADTRPKVVIQASAIGFYGPLADEIITENDLPGTDFLAKLCQSWEDSTQPVEALGVRRVIIRTGLVLDAEGGAFPLFKLPFDLYGGGPFGDGRQYMSWIHIADQVSAIRFLIDNQTTKGVYNLTAPNPHTNKDFGGILGKIIGKPAFIPKPAFLMRPLLGEVSTVLFDGQRVIPAKLEAAGFEFRYPELEPALRQILGK